jgi:6-pyruvoyl-tetrahydropterin synthase related domain
VETPHSASIPRAAWLLIPLAALFVLLPMFHHGLSCGHDLTFHITNWVEASQDWQHGILYPRWVQAPNFTAGEPRFIFYPPLSWALGAALGEMTGWSAAPFVFLFLVLCGAGAAMYRFARLALWPMGALAASLLYIANPYMLFSIYTRSAFAELLAAAVLPLLFFAILSPRIHIVLLAEVVAALWLSNAPAAVVGMYALLCVAILSAWRHRSLQHLLRIAAGTALGLGVAAIYIIPAAYERSWVQIGRIKEAAYFYGNNFLFGHMGEALHDAVQHQASLIAVILLALIAITTIVLLAQGHRWHPLQRRVFFVLGIFSAIVLFLLLPISSFLWKFIPELAFVQFPWRWLLTLAPIAALLFAAVLTRNAAHTAKTGVTRWVPVALAFLLAVICVHLSYHHFEQACDPDDTPRGIISIVESGAGVEGSDEYTPIAADTDDLEPEAPRVWLYSASEAAETHPAKHVDLLQHPNVTNWSPEYKHFSIDAPQSSIAILQLMDYPAWRVRINGQPVSKSAPASSGQLQIAVPAGHSDVEIKFDHTADRVIGDIITIFSLLLLALLGWRDHHRTRRTHPAPV